MKFLLFLLVISCGQHKEPKTLDLRDSDGDNEWNHAEILNGRDQFVANYSPLKELSGTMSFLTGQGLTKEIKVSFNNKTDLKKYALHGLTFNKKALVRNDYFGEMSKINLVNPELTPTFIKQDFYDVNLNFNLVKEKPKSLFLISEGEEVLLGEWSQDMQVRLGKDDLDRLLSGKIYFSLKKFVSPETYRSIQSQTYKTIVFDGKETHIFYVSKALSVASFQKKLKIKPQSIDDLDILNIPFSGLRDQWWKRKIENDWVFVYSKVDELKKSYLEGFEKKMTTIRRLEGVSTNIASVTKKEEAKIIFKFRSGKLVKKIFKQTSGVLNRGQHDDRYECPFTDRTVTKQDKKTLGMSEFKKLITLKVGGAIVDLKNQPGMQIIEGSDELGIYWNLILYAPVRDLKLSLESLTKNVFVQVGRIKDCQRVSMRLVSPETSFVIPVETFVEKI